ncbi:MAG: cbb3-type cytochrome c oxidase subunit 3 [Alphaproteobacteria bacterium]|nr:cbb3-type cytochrome c oxidase subunit 3 [Alphaproteobacteria bacterium]
MTVAFFGFFAAYAIWAWWPSNRAHMEAMAKAPLDDDLSSADGGKTYVLHTGGQR